MNEVDLWQQLSKVIPTRLRSQVAYVFERSHWPEIEVGFFNGRAGIHVVVLRKADWLNDAALARLCLEAP